MNIHGIRFFINQVLNSIDFSSDNESINSFDNSVISDPILYDYLLNNFDGIFSGGSIDTSISNNINFLNLDNLGITSIEGLEYFTKLETLYLNNNELNRITTSRKSKTLKMPK